jgi:hypothetical protein
MKKIIAFSVLLAIIGLSAKAQKVTFTIKDVITNFADAKSADKIQSDCSLQLVLNDGKGFPMNYDPIGRVSCVSNLPSIKMPANGNFSIVCNNIGPGTYLLSVQPANLPRQKIAFLLKDQQTLQIEIKKDSTTPAIIDVGSVIIP